MATRILILFLGFALSAWSQADLDQDQKRRVAALIESLCAPSPEVRADALDQLRRAAPMIEPILRENLRHADPEVVARCGDLLGELERKRAGERRIIGGRVIHTEATFNFILTDIGKQEALKPGSTFEIVRDSGPGKEAIVVAVAQFEKYIGAEGTFSKLRITFGVAADVRVGDCVAADVTPTLPAFPPGKGPEKPKAAVVPGPGPAVKVPGKVALVDGSRGLVATDLRERDGVKAGDLLQVTRAGEIVGTLVVSDVKAWGSWAKPEDVTKLGDLQKGDRLVSMEGKSLRYLTADVVRQKCLFPRYSNFTLEYERDCSLPKTGLEKFLVEFGFEVKLEAQGVVIQTVLPDSDADQAGLQAGDLLVSANGKSLRYLPLKKLLDVVLEGPGDHSVMSVRRFVLLPRK